MVEDFVCPVCGGVLRPVRSRLWIWLSGERDLFCGGCKRVFYVPLLD